MSDAITLPAPAKINLFLHITGILPNGYHELDTLFLALEAPCDQLTFTPGPAGSGCTVACGIPGLKQEDNLAWKAYRAFSDATGFSPDINIAIQKQIPTGAGLGGGSTDAATVLRYLNERAGDAALSLEQLIPLAAKLGADVPFFLMDTAARATGIGEKLTPHPIDLSGYALVLACPEVHVDTAWAYKTFDQEIMPGKAALTSEPTHNNEAAPKTLPIVHNDFESVVFRAFPVIRKVKETLLVNGASGAAMSGSGASVFALFRNAEDAGKATRTLAAKGMKTYTRHY